MKLPSVIYMASCSISGKRIFKKDGDSVYFAQAAHSRGVA